MPRILCVVLLLSGWQCRDTQHDNSPSPASESSDDGVVCPQLALAAFEQHIQPAIDAACGNGGCHVSDGTNVAGGGLELQKKQNDETFITNRAEMLSHRAAWLTEDGELLAKVGDDDPATHEGGNQVAEGNITEEDIVAWLEAEKSCRSDS